MGDPYSFRAATGDCFKGIVQVYEPRRQFSGTVENWNNSLLRVKVEPISGGEATVWLSSCGVALNEVNSFQQRWSELLARRVAD